ncbi:MAG: PAS domain-containing protein [Chthoniobacterales bacterium]
MNPASSPSSEDSQRLNELMALRHEVELQKQFFDALPASIAILDSSGVIVSANGAWLKCTAATYLLGPENKPGTNYLDACNEICGKHREIAQRAFQGIHRVMTGSTPNFWLEYPNDDLSSLRLFWLTVSPFSNGELNGAVIIHTDITERMESELALHESEERFRLTV